MLILNSAWARKRRLLVGMVVLTVAMMALIQMQLKAMFSKLPLSGSLDRSLYTFFSSGKETGYDVEKISRWYRGSTCSSLRDVFVGDQPLFPPCRPDIPPGIATWGQYPYVGLFHYLKSSKNPCWQQQDGLACVPYAFLAGVSKSGTSDLYARLAMHPDVVSSQKEIHWFDRFRYGNTSYRPQLRSFQAYTRKLSKLARRVKTDLEEQGHSKKIELDGSPSYFYDNYEWHQYAGNEGCTEPRVILANHIRHLYPDVKIILIIRHPVQRLYSRYLFDYQRVGLALKDPPSREKFHAYVEDGLSKYRQCFNRWSLRHCVYNKTLWESVHLLRIQESLYSVFLEDWLRVIPRDQIVFIRFEDYAKNITGELKRVYQYLGLDMLDDNKLKNIAAHGIMNKGQKKSTVGAMLPETERLLQDFYQPFVRRLGAMIGDKFLWKDVKKL